MEQQDKSPLLANTLNEYLAVVRRCEELRDPKFPVDEIATIRAGWLEKYQGERSLSIVIEIGTWYKNLSDNHREYIRKHGSLQQVRNRNYRVEFRDVDIHKSSLSAEFVEWNGGHHKCVMAFDESRLNLMLSILERGDMFPIGQLAEAEAEMHRLADAVGISYADLMEEKAMSDACLIDSGIIKDELPEPPTNDSD